jgi:hypothetical protein
MRKNVKLETSTRHAQGTFDPIVYFQNYRGVIALPPSTEDALRIKAEMAKRGFELREARTVAQVESLQNELKDQETRKREGRLEREEFLFRQSREERRNRLLTRRNSSTCTPFERDAIDAHLAHMDQKHAERQTKERAVEHYFEALEFNASSHHLMDAVHAVPDMRDEACTRCYNYRRVKGLVICARCANEVTTPNG